MSSWPSSHCVSSMPTSLSLVATAFTVHCSNSGILTLLNMDYHFFHVSRSHASSRFVLTPGILARELNSASWGALPSQKFFSIQSYIWSLSSSTLRISSSSYGIMEWGWGGLVRIMGRYVYRLRLFSGVWGVRITRHCIWCVRFSQEWSWPSITDLPLLGV